MISKIERGVSIPTATILGKLAAGLEIGLSRLLGGQLQRQALLVTPGEQPVFKDPDSELERRSLSPLFSDRSVDFVLNTLPPGRHVIFPPHHDGVEEYLYVAKGHLRVRASGKVFDVGSGSMLFYQANSEHEIQESRRRAGRVFHRDRQHSREVVRSHRLARFALPANFRANFGPFETSTPFPFIFYYIII